MVKETDPVLTKVLNDLKRVTDVTRILDEQEKLNAPKPHYNKAMGGATAPGGNASNATNATAPAAGAAPASDLPPELNPAAASDLPPELDPASAGAIQSKKATNASKGANTTKAANTT